MIPLLAVVLIVLVTAVVAFLSGWQVSRSRTYARELAAWERGWNSCANKKGDRQPGHG